MVVDALICCFGNWLLGLGFCVGGVAFGFWREFSCLRDLFGWLCYFVFGVRLVLLLFCFGWFVVVYCVLFLCIGLKCCLMVLFRCLFFI